MNGKVILLSAPSGAGKSTLIRHLLATFQNLSFSVSATTRPPRKGEVHGQHYYFMSVPEFESRVAQGHFVEYEQVYNGVFYGTLHSELERIWSKGHHVAMDVDVKGGLNLKKYFGSRALSIFIAVSDLSELRRRLEARAEDSRLSVDERIAKAKIEMQAAPYFDRIIFNDKLETAKDEIVQVVSQFLKT